jgi:hypothetical protein
VQSRTILQEPTDVIFRLIFRWKNRLLLLIAIFCSVGASGAKPYLEFDGTKYYQAYSGEASGSCTLMEYLPRKESLEHWNQMLSLRIFPTIKDPDSYLRELELSVKESNPAARAVVHHDSHMIDFLVFSEDGKMAEFNIMRVRYIKGTGLSVEQYARRYYDLHEKSLDEMQKLGGEVNAMRHRIIPLFDDYHFREIQ